MRKLLLLVAVMVAALGISAGIAMSQTTTEPTHYRIPYNEIVTNPVNGEEVTLTGDILVVGNVVRGDEVSFRVDHIAIIGSGTGSLGNKYKFASIETGSRSLTPELMEIEQKTIKIIGLGDAPDFGLTSVRHFGFTPGGPVIRFYEVHTHTSP